MVEKPRTPGKLKLVNENLWQDVRIPPCRPDRAVRPLRNRGALSPRRALAVRGHSGRVRQRLPGTSPGDRRPAHAAPATSFERAFEKLRETLEAELARALAAPPRPGDGQLDYRKRLLAVHHAEEALAAAGPRKAGRPPIPRSELERIAVVYSDAFHRHEAPVVAVAAFLGCGRSTAAKRIALCRERGVLAATEPGKAGGIPRRRVTARGLAELIDFNEAGAEFPRRAGGRQGRAAGRSASPGCWGGGLVNLPELAVRRLTTAQIAFRGRRFAPQRRHFAHERPVMLQ